MSSVQVESIGTDSKEIAMQEASLDIWDKKYRLKSKTGEVIDETIDHTLRRVARALADCEATPELCAHWYDRFLWALQSGAIPAGRIVSNAGALEHKPATSTINCTVSGTIGDSMDDILGKVQASLTKIQAGALRINELRQRVGIPALDIEIGAGKQHGGQHSPTDGRRRIARELPGADSAHQRSSLYRAVALQIFERQHPVAVSTMIGNRSCDLAFVENSGTFVSNRVE